jgi:hypothetical protein
MGHLGSGRLAYRCCRAWRAFREPAPVMADPATALPRRGRHGVGCRSRIGTPRCEQRSRWPFRRLHCRRRCHSPRRSQLYPSPVFRRPTRRRLRGQALSSLTRGLKSPEPVTQWCSGSGPCASCAAPLSWPRSSVHPDNEVSIHRRFFRDERSTPRAPTSSRRQPPVEVLAVRAKSLPYIFPPGSVHNQT